MNLFFRVFSNTGCIHTSHPEELQSHGQCTWMRAFSLPASSQLKNQDFLFLFMCVFKKSGFIFPWFDKRIHCTSLMQGAELFNARRKSKLMRTSGTVHSYAQKMQVEISLHYDADLKYLQCTQIECSFSSVVMKCEIGFAKSVLDDIWVQEYHKIVCLVRLGSGRAKRDFYLGRPQRIFHSPFSSRRLEWTLQDAAASPFPGMSVKTEQYWKEHEEQHLDMRRINALIEPLTARVYLKTPQQDQYEPDHDAFTNGMCHSPIALLGKQWTVQFFNLGVRGPHPPWVQFDSETAHHSGLFFRLVLHNDCICHIILEASNYHQTLRFESNFNQINSI